MVTLDVQIRLEALAPLRSTLHSWLHIIREYASRLPQNEEKRDEWDFTYWHGERSQVGFLSIAAWTNGWATLQEWPLQKKSRRGRNDLWLGREGLEFFIEAKIGQCRIDKGRAFIDSTLKEHLQIAAGSADELIDRPPCHRIAAAFVSPVFRTSQADFDLSTDHWLEAMAAASDAAAVLFPHVINECPVDKYKQRRAGLALILSKAGIQPKCA